MPGLIPRNTLMTLISVGDATIMQLLAVLAEELRALKDKKGRGDKG